ncbi:MAG: hypothetical protein AB2L20_25720 [Mangrovibacterium sp.]
MIKSSAGEVYLKDAFHTGMVASISIRLLTFTLVSSRSSPLITPIRFFNPASATRPIPLPQKVQNDGTLYYKRDNDPD